MDAALKKKHTKYEKKAYSRRLVRDSVEGSDAIKKRNSLYLPIPTGFLYTPRDAAEKPTMSFNAHHTGVNDADIDISAMPFYHPNPAYMGYLQRARFPDVTKHTLRGLVGTAAKKPLDVKVPSQIEYMIENATNDGLNVDELYAYCLAEVLQTGNMTLVVDVNPKLNQVYISTYCAETFINWREKNRENDLTLAVYNYKTEEIDGDFGSKEVDTYFVYALVEEKDADGKVKSEEVTQMTFYDSSSTELKDSVVVPSLQGNYFPRIPVVPIGAIENSFEPQTAPLLGIAEIAIAIYQKDADLSNSEHMTCNPNLVIVGADAGSSAPVLVGAQTALIIPNPQGRADYTKTDTSGLDHVMGRITTLFEEAMLYGASLSGPAKKGVEASETVKERKNSQGATLIDVAKNVAKGIEEAFELAAEIHGASRDAVEINPNLEFAEEVLSAQMLQALNAVRITTGISLETFLKKMEKAGLIEDWEEELKRLTDEGTVE